MDLCPRCKKYVNTNTQVLTLNDVTHRNIFCEECGMTISSVTEKNIRKENEDGTTKGIIE